VEDPACGRTPARPGPACCSVIVPTYNRRRLLDQTLDALARQSLPPGSFEVLVVDDGSSDRSDEVVRSYEGRLRVRYFYQPDQGFRLAEARNIGIRHATAPICVFVDSGILLHSQCLEAHLHSHATSPRPAAVLGYIHGYGTPADRSPARHGFPEDADQAIGRLATDPRFLDAREALYWRHGDRLDEWKAPWLLFWTGNASASTELIRRVGMFDEAFRSWGVEDQDLGYRLHQANARFVLNRQALCLHEDHPRASWKHYLSYLKNSAYFARKFDTPQARIVLNVSIFDIDDVMRRPGWEERFTARPWQVTRMLRDLRHEVRAALAARRAPRQGRAQRAGAHRHWNGPAFFENP
jgi:glycosyltransferase involved in cell wall biosynthesis